jgi:flagellar protein FliS
MVASAYARVYRANSILTATPGQLVLMLYDSALASLEAAQGAFGRSPADLKRYEDINRHLRKAQRIIAELRQSLNFEAGGDFAPLMHRLYEYYNRRLVEANMQKKVEPVVEVEGLLRELRDAWAEMLKRPEAGAAVQAPEAQPALR